MNDELPEDVIYYWKEISKTISLKNKKGKAKNPAEKFAEIMIDYAASNDKKYYEKKCEKNNF